MNENYRILIVEDNFVNIQILKEFLSNNFILEIARNAEIALKLLGEIRFDLILMDINLGKGINGLELTEIIKSKEVYKNVPIIGMTGYYLQEETDKLKSKGFNLFLFKPFNRNELINSIKNLLS